jgi:dipeptidyl aminopeptidase/acylaminoacyl peptidase
VQRDIREETFYKAVEEHFRRIHEPAFGTVSAVGELSATLDGSKVAFSGAIYDRLVGHAKSRICLINGSRPQPITSGPNDDRIPNWSPDGSRLAFLSDRAERGVFQLYLLDSGVLGEARPTPHADGTVEYHSWSPDGLSILLGVAGRGADLSTAQGSGTSGIAVSNVPSWLPEVVSGVGEHEWRSVWRYDVSRNETRQVSRPGLNVWESAWAGPRHLLAVVSDSPDEGAWYSARLSLIDTITGEDRTLAASPLQLGWPCASPSGSRVAVVEAVASDRWLVAGRVLVGRITEPESLTAIDTRGVDVTALAWLDEDRLSYLGLRGLDTVAGLYDLRSGTSSETWTTAETCGGHLPEGAFLSDGRLVVAIESYERPQEIAVVGRGQRALASLAHRGTLYMSSVAGRVEDITWSSPGDGTSIQGLLCVPPGSEPFPLVVHIHGGPVWAFRNRWSMGHPLTPLLVSNGYAVLHPNPRGSVGRGHGFASAIVGDMGGVDTGDHLSGIDTLVAAGVADRERLGVFGGSYGGYMSAWLVTQDHRFRAAVSMAPATNWYSQHLTSNIGTFDSMFLDDDPRAPDSRFHSRSPVMHAKAARTPTLLIAGALDKCAPPGQAREFHRALTECGVQSALVIYPEEGHGIRGYPAVIDQCARALWWFQTHMPARLS